MSQSPDFTLANQPGATFRSELNIILAALASGHSGATAPPVTLAGMLWADTSSGQCVLKMRNITDTAWLVVDPTEFGIGVSQQTALSNIDTLTQSGFYTGSNTATGIPTSEAHRVIHLPATASSAAAQIAIGSGTGRVWVRTKTGGAWTAWSEFAVGALTTSLFAAAALRTSGEGFASLVDTELATAAWVKAFVDSNPWTYTSSQQTITSGSSLTLAHGLAARPTEVRLVVRCTTAQAPYAVGDEVEVTDFSGASQWGASISADATNLIIRTGAGGHFLINNAGNAVALTNGSWRYIARAR